MRSAFPPLLPPRTWCALFLLLLLAMPLLPHTAGAQAPATPSREVSELPLVKGAPDAKPLAVKRAKSSVGSVLFVQTEAGTTAKYTTISGALTPIAANAPGELAYDRFLGPLTIRSLDGLMRGVQALHGGWPRGQKITLAFSEHPVPAELTPANLPSALLLDSMIRDFDLDPSYAALGVLLPDGSIDRVENIAGRLNGAARARIARVAVPEKNRTEVADYLLSAGVAAFVGTQIFTVKQYNEAGVLSLTQLDPATAEVVKLYGSVQRTLAVVGGRAVDMLRDPHTQGVLQKVLDAAPNHLSARILLDWGTGAKTQISLGGSMEAIDRYAPTLMRAFRAPDREALATPKPKLLEETNALRVLRPRVDTHAQPWLDALLRYSDALQKAQASKGSKALTEALDTAREAGNAEWTKAVQARMAQPVEKP